MFIYLFDIANCRNMKFIKNMPHTNRDKKAVWEDTQYPIELTTYKYTNENFKAEKWKLQLCNSNLEKLKAWKIESHNL